LVDYYQITSLMEECKNQVDEEMKASQTYKIYRCAIPQEIKQICETRLIENLVHVSSSIVLDPEHFLNFLSKAGLYSVLNVINSWIAMNKKNNIVMSEEILGKLKPYIHLEMCTVKDLSQTVWPMGIFPAEAILDVIRKKS